MDDPSAMRSLRCEDVHGVWWRLSSLQCIAMRADCRLWCENVHGMIRDCAAVSTVNITRGAQTVRVGAMDLPQNNSAGTTSSKEQEEPMCETVRQHQRESTDSAEPAAAKRRPQCTHSSPQPRRHSRLHRIHVGSLSCHRNNCREPGRGVVTTTTV